MWLSTSLSATPMVSCGGGSGAAGELGTTSQAVSGPPQMPAPLAPPEAPLVAPAGVGYLPMSTSVTPAGHYTIDVPIAVPPGRNGMQPAVSLRYSSGQQANGALGVGWSLSAGGAITRCHQTVAADGRARGVHYRPYSEGTPEHLRDRFCLNGNKLVAIRGAYGEDGTEYRTELDHNVRVVSHNEDGIAPSSFTVQTGGGITQTYRARTGTRYAATVDSYTSGSSRVTTHWALTDERDVSGNGIEYTYTQVDGGPGGSQDLLENIFYTSHPSLNGGWNGGDGGDWRRVHFEYELRPDREVSWQAGVPAVTSRRLKTVTMYAPDPAESQPVWHYALSYGVSDYSGRSRIASIEQCAIDRGRVAGCKWRRYFSWTAPAKVPAFDGGQPPISETTFGELGPGGQVDKDRCERVAPVSPATVDIDEDVGGYKFARTWSSRSAPYLVVSDINGDQTSDVIWHVDGGDDRPWGLDDDGQFVVGQAPRLVLSGDDGWQTIDLGRKNTGGIASTSPAWPMGNNDWRLHPKMSLRRNGLVPVDVTSNGKPRLLRTQNNGDAWFNDDPLTDDDLNQCEDGFVEWDGTKFAPVAGYEDIGSRACESVWSTYRPKHGDEVHQYVTDDLSNQKFAWAPSRQTRFADMNGDGRTDLLISGSTDAAAVAGSSQLATNWNVAPNSGSGFPTIDPAVLDAHDVARINAGCPTHVVDFDGDGTAELFGQLGSYAEWPDDPGNHVTTEYPGGTVDCGAPQVESLEGDDIQVRYGTASLPRVRTGLSAVGGRSRHPWNFTPPVGQAEDALIFADLNGDGLADVLERDPLDQDPSAVFLRWNTGNGFSPPTQLAGTAWAAGTFKVRTGDVNRDGRADLVVFHDQPQRETTLMISNGDGTFTTDQLGDPGYFAFPLPAIPSDIIYYGNNWEGVGITYEVSGFAAVPGDFPTSELGDFDGDGRLDLIGMHAWDPVSLADQEGDPGWYCRGELEVRYQANQPHHEAIWGMYDHAGPGFVESVRYDDVWSDAPSRAEEYECSYPQQCLRRGLIVAREVSRYRQVADQPGPSTRKIHYSYDDPVVDLAGRGFLGFQYFREWDPAIPSETVTQLDNFTRVTDGDTWSYPFAGMPRHVRTITPIVASSRGGGREREPGREPTGPTAANARIATVSHDYELRQLDGRYAVYPKTELASTWEEHVDIDWSLPSLGGPELPERTHLHGLDYAVPRLRRTTTRTNDAYGNPLATTIFNEYGNDPGSKLTIDAEYEYRTDDAWLLGLPRRRKTSSTRYQDAGPQASMTRTVDFHHDALGRLDTIWFERDSADPSVRATAHLKHDDFGNVVEAATSARAKAGDPADSARVRHISYEQAYPGAFAEHIFPSQVWADHDDPACAALGKDCRPSAWVIAHPGLGLPLATMDVNGARRWARYDRFGRTVQLTGDGRPAVSFAYAGRPDTQSPGDFHGLVITTTIGNQQLRGERDRDGHLLTSTARGFDGTPVVTLAEYDLFGRPRRTSRPHFAGGTPMWTALEFDSLGRQTKVTHPDGSARTSSYAGLFQTTRWDEEGAHTTTHVDYDGQLRRSWNTVDVCADPGDPSSCYPQDVGTTFVYGAFGLLQKVLDDTNQVTVATTYDVLGRAVKTSEIDAGETTLVLNGFGDVVESSRDGVGTVSSTFDDLGRPLTTTSPDGTTSIEWDTAAHGIGRPAVTTSVEYDDLQFRYVHGYDGLGRAASTTLQMLDDGNLRAAFELAFTYDAQGRLSTLSYPEVPGRERLVVRHDYNGHDYLRSVTDITAGQPPRVLSEVTQRNAELAMTQGFLGDGAIGVQRAYDPSTGNLDEQRHSYAGFNGVVELLAAEYEYRKDGLVKKRTTDDADFYRTERFAYDALKRLTSWDLTSQQVGGNSIAWTAPTTGYAYDLRGNLTAIWKDTTLLEQRGYGNAGARPHALTDLLDVGDNTHTLYQYDGGGRMITDGARTLTYTAFDLPRTVTLDGDEWKLWYDAHGRRVLKTGPGGATLYAGDLFERRASGGEVTDVFHVPGVDGTRAQINYVENVGTPYEGAPNPRYLYPLTDALGSTGVVVDQQGVVVDRSYYDPFGQRVKPTGGEQPSAGPLLVTLGFTGQEHDDDLGLLNFGGRMYDPAMKRFLTPDPLVAAPSFSQSWNRYSYVLNSPLNLTDPSGFSPVPQGSVIGDWIQTEGQPGPHPSSGSFCDGPACERQRVATGPHGPISDYHRKTGYINEDARYEGGGAKAQTAFGDGSMAAAGAAAAKPAASIEASAGAPGADDGGGQDFGTLGTTADEEDPAHPFGGWEGLGGVPFMIPSDLSKDILDPKVKPDAWFPRVSKQVTRGGAMWDLYDIPQTLYDAMPAPLINNMHRPNQAYRAQVSMYAIQLEIVELHLAMQALTDAGVATQADLDWALEEQWMLDAEYRRLEDLLESGALQGPFKAGWPIIDFIPGGSLLPQIEPGTEAFDRAERLIRFKNTGDCPRCEARPFRDTPVDQNLLR